MHAARNGWQVCEVCEDVASGEKASRLALDRLLADARARRFDIVLVWKLDRFGRSLRDCLGHLETLERHGIRFVAVTQGLDTSHSNPAGRFLLHILGAAAEFERELIRDRVRAGMQAARRAGKNLGRPKAVFRRDQALRMRAEGASVRAIARTYGVGLATVMRALNDAA
jgi:DNA invertase Pin-like site-specific DNA recombinase